MEIHNVKHVEFVDKELIITLQDNDQCTKVVRVEPTCVVTIAKDPNDDSLSIIIE